MQDLDIKLSQLAHKKANLPEHAEIGALEGDLAQQRDLLVAAQTEESDTAREQTKAEQDVDQVRQRSARNQQRLDSGAVTSPKDLESLQSEIASLARRQDTLEDVVLEIMERNEAASARVVELKDRVASVQAKLDDAAGRRASALQELDKEVARIDKERAVLSEAVPEDLLRLYDKLRAQQGGVGAARLYQGRCEGCRLELNITEMNEIRAAAPQEVLRCENCRRILVRTSESGL